MHQNVRTVVTLTLLAIVLGVASWFSNRTTAWRLLDQASFFNVTEAKDSPIRLVRVSSTAPDIGAEAAFVRRLSTGEILFDRNASQAVPIASLTKLMTAFLLAEWGSAQNVVVFTETARNAGNSDDKRSAVTVGDMISVPDVAKFLLISSDSDAAYAAAEYVGGLYNPNVRNAPAPDRVHEFVLLMNSRAESFGMTHTSFSNPVGTDDPRNYSTARDVALLVEKVTMLVPELWRISTLTEARVVGMLGNSYTLENTDLLLHEFPGIKGSKTGFEDQAGEALALLYEISPGDYIAIVILKSSDRFQDARALIRWVESSFVLESAVTPS